MKFTLLTAALLLLLPHSVVAQSTPQTWIANRSLDVATLDAAGAEQYIEQLARAYRVNVYNVYRTDRAQYNQHRAELQETLDAWRAAGSPAAERKELITWLEEAIRAVQNAPPTPLPARPVFDAKITEKPATVQRDQSAKPAPPKVDEIAPAPPLPPTAKPPSEIAPAIEPPAEKPPAQPSITTPDIATTPATPPSPAIPPLPKPSAQAGKEPSTRQPIPSDTQPGPVEKPAPTQRQTPQIPSLPTLADGDIAPAPPIPSQAKQPARIAPKVPAPQRSVRPRSSVPPANSVAGGAQRPSFSRSTPSRSSLRSSRRAAAINALKPKNSAEPAEKSPARSPALPTLPGLSAKEIAAMDKDDKASLAISKDADGDDSGAEVNLIELAARIAGNNMALRGVEAQLSTSREWDSTQLTAMVTALKQLSDRRHDLTLFRNLLPESDRRLVGELESPRTAISQCSARISETRERVDSRGYRSRQKDSEEELKKLDALSQELAKLVTGS